MAVTHPLLTGHNHKAQIYSVSRLEHRPEVTASPPAAMSRAKGGGKDKRDNHKGRGEFVGRTLLPQPTPWMSTVNKPGLQLACPQQLILPEGAVPKIFQK
eukprot:8314437-Karenia_brevis.AAC.1